MQIDCFEIPKVLLSLSPKIPRKGFKLCSGRHLEIVPFVKSARDITRISTYFPREKCGYRYNQWRILRYLLEYSYYKKIIFSRVVSLMPHSLRLNMHSRIKSISIRGVL